MSEESFNPKCCVCGKKECDLTALGPSLDSKERAKWYCSNHLPTI